MVFDFLLYPTTRRKLLEALTIAATQGLVPGHARLLLGMASGSSYAKRMAEIHKFSQNEQIKWPLGSVELSFADFQKMLDTPLLYELATFRDLSALVNEALGDTPQQRKKVLDAVQAVASMKKNFFIEESVGLCAQLSLPDGNSLRKYAPEYGLTTMARFYGNRCKEAVEQGLLSPEKQEGAELALRAAIAAEVRKRGVNPDIIDIFTDPGIRFDSLSNPFIKGGVELWHYIRPEDSGDMFAQRIAKEIADTAGFRLQTMMSEHEIDLKSAQPILDDIQQQYQRIFERVFGFSPSHLPEFSSPALLSPDSIKEKRARRIANQEEELRENREALKIVNALLRKPFSCYHAPIAGAGETMVWFAEIPYPCNAAISQTVRQRLNRMFVVEQNIPELRKFLKTTDSESMPWKIIPARPKQLPPEAESIPDWPGKPDEAIKISINARSKEELKQILEGAKTLLERRLGKSSSMTR